MCRKSKGLCYKQPEDSPGLGLTLPWGLDGERQPRAPALPAPAQATAMQLL